MYVSKPNLSELRSHMKKGTPVSTRIKDEEDLNDDMRILIPNRSHWAVILDHASDFEAFGTPIRK